MLRIVIDTNVWIRILLRGPATLPVLSAWQAGQFRLVTSQALLDEVVPSAISGEESITVRVPIGKALARTVATATNSRASFHAKQGPNGS